MGGAVTTEGKFEQRYGYFEARVRLQTQPGHWPAFWLFTDGVYGIADDGRDGTEVDILEKPWLNDSVQHTLHWDGYEAEYQWEGLVSRTTGIMTGYHTYAVSWSPTEYVFFVDGRETWRTNAGGVSQVPQFIILSDEVGAWGGDITTASLPDRVLFDYVRVYQVPAE